MSTTPCPTAGRPVRRRVARRGWAWWSVLVLGLAALGTVGAPAAAGGVRTAVAGPAVSLTVSTRDWMYAGFTRDVTVTARDAAGQVATSYLGRVHFTSTDPRSPVLPADYTFTSADQGVHTFTGLSLHTAGVQTVTARDTVSSTVRGFAAVRVLAGPPTHFNVSAPYQVTAGVPFAVTVSPRDAWENVTVFFTGTVALTSSDPNAGPMPSPHTFTGADKGYWTFTGVTLVSIGQHTVVATGGANPSYTGSDLVRVR